MRAPGGAALLALLLMLWAPFAGAQPQPDEVPGLLEEATRLGRAYRGARRREATAAARKAKAYSRSRRA